MMKMPQPNMIQLQRLWINDEAMKQAFNRLRDAIIGGEKEEIYASIGEMLLWVVSTHDWHLKFNLNGYQRRYLKDERGVTLLGLRHAFNLMKHNMDFINLHIEVVEPLFSFPFEGEIEFGSIECRWIEAGPELNGSNTNQKKNYVKHLENKSVFKTLEAAMNFLIEERFPMHID